ncbi:MAG TPA: hypothetical protein DEO49_01675 [Sutterella sp.]|nr:hypothetical protein [Sutterella sp.]
MSAKKVAIVSATAVAVLAALYTAAGYLAVPAAVKWAVGKYLPEALDGKNATVESVSFNPWGLVLEVQNLKVESAKHPGTNVLSLGNLKADASIGSLFKMAPILEQLSVKSLIVDYDQTPAGARAKKTVTESSMVQGAAGAAKAAKSKGKSESKGFSIPALSLADVSLSDSSVRFRDASQGVDVQATEINFQLPLISTLASSTDLPEMTPKLSLKLDGNPISATGKTTKNGATITVNIPELDAAKIIKALPVKLPVAVNSLHLSADVTADYSMAKGASNVLVSGKVHAANINVTQSSYLAFAARSLDVDLGKIDVFGQKAHVASVALASPDARGSLKRILSLASLDADQAPSVRLASSGLSPIGTAHAAQQAGWDWSVGSVKLTDGKVTVKDDTLKTPATLALSAINISATNVTQAPGARTKVGASMNVAKGSAKLDADASLASLAGNARLALSSIDLSALAPWIRHYGQTSVASGQLSANTSLSAAMAGKSPAVKLSGKASLANLSATYLELPASVRLGSLAVDIKDVDTAKQTAAIGSVVVSSPSVSVARSSLEKNSGKKPEQQQKKSSGKSAPAASKGSEAPAWNWSVASVELKDGSATLKDDTLKPAASLTVSKINLKTQNLSSQKGATSPYSVSAAVAQGTFTSEGKFSLTPLSVTASNKINGISLPTFNPWLAASGASMTKGAASMNGALTFKQADKTALSWKGNMQIDDFSAKKGGATVLSWQKAMANNVNLKSIDPVDVSIELVEIDQPMQKLMKQEQKVSALIGLFTKGKHASSIEKFETKLRKDLKLHNLTYKNGKFSAGQSDNTLGSVLLKGLDSVFGKN